LTILFRRATVGFLLGFVLTEVHLERFADALNSAGQDPDRTTVRHGTLRSTSARP
jgi:hypothetical protein